MNNFQVAASAAATIISSSPIAHYPDSSRTGEFDKWANHILKWIQDKEIDELAAI